MNYLRLKISNLRVDVDLSELKPRVFRELAGSLSPFTGGNGHAPHETLEVVPLRAPGKKGAAPDLEALITRCLRVPLAKFPFPPDPEKEIENSLTSLRPFSGDPRFRSFFNDLENPEEILVELLDGGCLLRRQRPARSLLFLKTGYFRGPRIQSICRAVHTATSMALPLVDCIMLHGVGINRQGIGHLFLGLSGSGKTTLARFSAPEEVISDDGIIVERDGSDYYLAPAPLDQSPSYRGDGEKSPPGRTRLSMGLLLKKDSRTYLEKVLPSDACSIILKNHVHYFRHFPPESVEKTFSLIADLCRRVPFYSLHFRKEPSFWSLILEEMSHIIQSRGDSNGLNER